MSHVSVSALQLRSKLDHLKAELISIISTFDLTLINMRNWMDHFSQATLMDRHEFLLNTSAFLTSLKMRVDRKAT